MKIPYKHIIKHIQSKPLINELSERLFQLGHEHEIEDDVYNFELTPNRGDCLSLKGILRELRVFYDVDINFSIYEKEIASLKFPFKNKNIGNCPIISFLKIDIEKNPTVYIDELSDYLSDLNVKKNNFFSDVSNFISYETGQPTHCYDFEKINAPISLELIDKKIEFKTLHNQDIGLSGKNLVFFDKNHEVINLAGIMGGLSTSCSKNSKSVLIECAYFNPEIIIGKQIKYDIPSDAAYKFERNADPACHENTLRRFLRIVEKHCKIKNVEILSSSNTFDNTEFFFCHKKINKILGTDIVKDKLNGYLSKLGFTILSDRIVVPSYRHDIQNENDIAEEIARCVGYDNIPNQSIKLSLNKIDIHEDDYERNIKSLLIDNGFYEVINNPFVSDNIDNAIKVVNPLDKNKAFLRLSLKQSLINNLLYNERRQQDSVKLFEISDVYSLDSNHNKRVLGIISSGRRGNNYKDFSKKIDDKFISEIFQQFIPEAQLKFKKIDRKSIKSKLKNHISYVEIEVIELKNINYNSIKNINIDFKFKKYKPISSFPCSMRDISFSVKDFSKIKSLEFLVLNFKNNLLKESFVFDFYENKKNKEVKIGFRFIFQSNTSNLIDADVDNLINQIINDSLQIETVTVPGHQ